MGSGTGQAAWTIPGLRAVSLRLEAKLQDLAVQRASADLENARRFGRDHEELGAIGRYDDAAGADDAPQPADLGRLRGYWDDGRLLRIASRGRLS